jgi:hypothetical protein
MCEDDQKLEVIRLNKGAASGMKGAIKKLKIDVQYKGLVSEKMKAFIVSSPIRAACSELFRRHDLISVLAGILRVGSAS